MRSAELCRGALSSFFSGERGVPVEERAPLGSLNELQQSLGYEVFVKGDGARLARFDLARGGRQSRKVGSIALLDVRGAELCDFSCSGPRVRADPRHPAEGAFPERFGVRAAERGRKDRNDLCSIEGLGFALDVPPRHADAYFRERIAPN